MELSLEYCPDTYIHPITRQVFHNLGDKLYAVLSTEKAGTRYVDADERPWDDSHDGNGWNVPLWRVQLADNPAESFTANVVRACTYMDRDFVRRALSNAGAEGKQAILRAMNDWVTHGMTGRMVRPDGTWEWHIPLPEPEVDSDDDWETL